MCTPTTDACFQSKCESCSVPEKIKGLTSLLDDEEKQRKLSFFQWKSIERNGFKQISKVNLELTVENLLLNLIPLTKQYLEHIYIQRSHVAIFENDKKEALQPQSEVGVHHI